MYTKSESIADKLLYLMVAACCGCSSGSLDPQPPKQPSTAASPASDSSASVDAKLQSTAEVSESFSDFETAVKQPATRSQVETRTETQGAIPKPQAIPATTEPNAPALPAPTPEQLKRWAVNGYEPLQLLACRDFDQAGFVTAAAIIRNNDNYALAGNRLTTWSLDKTDPTRDYGDSSNERVIKTLAAAPDGTWLATGDTNGNLQIFDLPDLKPRVSKKIYPGAVAHLAISPDSKAIATASFTGEVTIWDAVQITPLHKMSVAKQALQTILFVTSKQLAVASEDAGIWNVETGKLEHSLTQGGYDATFALSADGKYLAYSKAGRLELWNVAESHVDSVVLGHSSNKALATFSPDGKYLATASRFFIEIWEVATGNLVQVIDSFGWQTTALEWLPTPSLLMIASENGRVRFWGSQSASSALDWKPLHTPLADADVEALASPAQLMQVVDVRTLPKLPGAAVSAINETLVSYTAPSTMQETKVFYHHLLTGLGWSQTNEPNSPPNAMSFAKQGFGLSLYFSPNPDGSTLITLNTVGNVDLRQLPKIEEAPAVIYEAANSVQYRVKGTLLDIETSLLRRFHKAGWTAYARLNASKNEETNSRSLQFIRGATTLLVTVQPQATEPGTYVVSYNKFLTTKSLPIPNDSGFIEFDGSTQPLLVASTGMTLEQTRDFYEKEMAEQGWLRRDSGKSFKEKTGWMEFIRGQYDVSIVLEILESGRTQIRVGEGLENSSWQLRKTKESDASVASSGIEAADFPALNGWRILKYNPESKQIDLSASGATTIAFAEAYTKELESRGWKTDGRGVKSEEYLLADFTKGKAEITLRATMRANEVQASFTGDGLMWTKPLPVTKQIIGYETWLRINSLPASLDHLDRYTAEMKAIAVQ